MKIERVDLIAVRLPLVRPFRTSRMAGTDRHTFLLRVTTDTAEGWGEFGGDPEPLYSAEFAAGAHRVLRDHLVPRVVAQDTVTTARTAVAMAPVKGNPMAKALLETAILDAECRTHSMPLATYLGAVRDRVPAGVSVGITDTIAGLLDVVSGYLAQGYARIKLKIEPGWDVEPVRAVRREFGDELALQVDANTAYSLVDAQHLRGLDEFGLVQIEQPLGEDDLRGHAELAKLLRTPICLDESIRSAADAAVAIGLGACRVVNIKPSRVGGYLEARRIHDVCTAQGIPVWCGGMLETGVGRAQNLALAGLPGFVLPNDLSASSRYYAEDITEPFLLDNGCLSVPDGPGSGVTVLPETLSRYTVSTETLYER
ncbi:o-succinylbenzoate synthase [Kibdelosporangium phytohabitans]|uniref:o-succinylbenzoate synthase n=1 Tax=Kibdelosporangium phytohabitans TaxID=860235 RepID=A0A0N7F4P3_9PSEU|nr:o-succinylbenzoate synthase [Kibdelosporangium phytohabitans]ALG11991.1 o-succinylbenzoate synthase [Kibdelosporangium phytohabitans]MBE1463458.1 O-succinylbenzoate synthase [Kibdelosporangium phytohabitans]